MTPPGDYSSYQCLRFERRDHVLQVSLNRPDALNAVNEQLHFELSQVFHHIAYDTQAHVVVLTGEGRAFCAGGDVSMMDRLASRGSRFGPMNVEGKRIVYSMLELEKPVICRMNGDAIGLGATLALLCDIIIANENARIGDPHVRVGLVAGDGGALLWPQLIGYARAKELLLTGDLVPAPKAAELGLINYAVPAEGLDNEVAAMADKLAGGAAKALGWTKSVANTGLKQLMHSVMDSGMAHEVLSMHEDFHEQAVKAFLGRKKG
jgi:enoyl-CoA hydratase